MSNKVNFVDNYIKYLINKYVIFTQQQELQQEQYNGDVDVELLKNLLKNKRDFAFDKIKNTDKSMIDLTKQISNTVFIYKICDKTRVSLDENIYLHYKKYKCLKYKDENCC
jgi:hypothetical protein